MFILHFYWLFLFLSLTKCLFQFFSDPEMTSLHRNAFDMDSKMDLSHWLMIRVSTSGLRDTPAELHLLLNYFFYIRVKLINGVIVLLIESASKQQIYCDFLMPHRADLSVFTHKFAGNNVSHAKFGSKTIHVWRHNRRRLCQLMMCTACSVYFFLFSNSSVYH